MFTLQRSNPIPPGVRPRLLRPLASSSTGALLALCIASFACTPSGGQTPTDSESEGSSDRDDDDEDVVESSEGGSNDESTSGDDTTTGTSGTSTSTSTSSSGTTSGGDTSTSTTGDTTTGTTSGDDTTTGTDTTSTTGTDSETIPGEFQPCPSTGPCKILPLGDSITEGLVGGQFAFNGGYRVELFRLALQDGHDITFTGMSPNGPNGPDTVDGVPFPKNHEGVSGDVINGIRDRGLRAIGTDMPHIILLHAGTNDLNVQPDGIPMRLADCVDALIGAAPDALLVVASVIPWGSQNNASVDAYNATIEPMVQERADAGAHVIFVDQFSAVPISMMPDSVHPNTEGYALMGQRWYETIESYLP